MAGLSRPVRAGIALLAGAGAGLACVFLLAVVDLYLTGHGSASLMRDSITWEDAGVHMSAADLILIIAALAVAFATWRASRPR